MCQAIAVSPSAAFVNAPGRVGSVLALKKKKVSALEYLLHRVHGICQRPLTRTRVLRAGRDSE